MDSLATENWPESCSSLGLDCGTCVHKAASSVASICGGLDSQGLMQIFLQLYPSAGCRPMAQTFEMAYQQTAIPLATPILATAAAA
jgi:hypothetical protein